MSRGRKRSKAAKRRRRRENQLFHDVVQETTSLFTCSFEMAKDSRDQCQRRLDELETDLRYARLAHELWADRSAATQPLAATIADIIAECDRHRRALLLLAQRCAELAADPHLHHEHLDPPEAYRDLVWRRIFPEIPSPHSPPSP